MGFIRGHLAQPVASTAAIAPMSRDFVARLRSYDVADSLVPSSLKPGQSAVVMIAFATNQIDGQFSLRENTQLQQVIVSTTLRHP